MWSTSRLSMLAQGMSCSIHLQEMSLLLTAATRAGQSTGRGDERHCEEDSILSLGLACMRLPIRTPSMGRGSGSLAGDVLLCGPFACSALVEIGAQPAHHARADVFA